MTGLRGVKLRNWKIAYAETIKAIEAQARREEREATIEELEKRVASRNPAWLAEYLSYLRNRNKEN